MSWASSWMRSRNWSRKGSGLGRHPQELLARAITGYAEGVLGAQAIATLRGISVEAAKQELDDAGVARGEPPIAWAEPADLPDVEVDLAALEDDLNTPADGQDATAERDAG